MPHPRRRASPQRSGPRSPPRSRHTRAAGNPSPPRRKCREGGHVPASPSSLRFVKAYPKKILLSTKNTHIHLMFTGCSLEPPAGWENGRIAPVPGRSGRWMFTATPLFGASHRRDGRKTPASEGRAFEMQGRGVEPADKPGSVVDDHSSRATVAGRLRRPTRIQRGPRVGIPIWPCSGRGLPGRRRCRRTRCALTAPLSPLPAVDRRAVCFPPHFPWARAPRGYLAPCPAEPGLAPA